MEEGQARPARDENARSRDTRAEAVYRATLAIATELSLDTALQKIVDAARELVNARYAALGVVDEERRRLTRFVVSGMTDEQVRKVGHWPRGLGLLGELIHFPRPLRVKDISKDPRSVGVPPHHPRMKSFLGVPIIRGNRVLGNFYMTDKEGAEEFSEGDEEILSLFAAHAAIAIENARLYTETDILLREKIVEVERAERRSRFLAELGALLLRLSPGEDPPIQRIVERATEPLGDVGAIYLVEPGDSGTVVASAVFHRAPHRKEAAERALQRSWEAIRHQVLLARGSALLPEIGEGAGHASSPFDLAAMVEGRFSAALAVPIATRQSTYGVFVSLASRPLTFSEDDLRFATLMADQLSGALHSARLHRREMETRGKVEELARLAQQRASELETVLNTMAEAVYVVDKDMRMVRRNRAYDQMVGASASRQVITTLHDHFTLLNPRDERGEPLAFDQLPPVQVLAGESFTNRVIMITPLSGKGDRYLSISGSPIHDADGQIVAAVNVARDVTEVKEVDLLKDEFISVASHELKTPLTVVKGYAQILVHRLRSLPERAGEAKMAGQILEQTNRMSDLAERLLDVSRIQFGRLTLEKQQVDLAALVREVAERIRMGVKKHPIHISAGRPAPARVDPGRIEQVITNLISNAAKYSPDGADIDVAVERQDNQTLISVRDHGYGIPREQQPHIFRRFFRASTGQGKQGAGLGLYVSKGIVETHGGRIWFDSEEGKGTTFYVALPSGN
ncbi:MAG: GAF domain-containing protein [Sphingomonadaceae bacterium]